MRNTDSFTVPGMIFSEVWRRYSRRIRNTPLYNWRYSRSTPNGLVTIPTDLRPVDGLRAHEFYAGQYTFAQTSVSTRGESPFSVQAPNPEWFSSLHSFRWMRHLAVSNNQLVQATSNALVTDWITIWGNDFNGDAWVPEIASIRLIAWLSYAPILLENAGRETHQIFLKSLGKHVGFLKQNAPFVADGYPRLVTYIALAYASLCIAGYQKSIKVEASRLCKELDRQILPDGGHISRNPLELVNILADLIPLKQAYIKLGHEPSAKLLAAIDRGLLALKFFSHSDKSLAQFNGAGCTPELLLKRLLQFCPAGTMLHNSAPDSGFERLAENGTVILVDSGGPRGHGATQQAMAGTLSFELSCRKNRFITNCGIPVHDRSLYAPFARATAAHSTATVADTSSAYFARDSKIHKFLPTPFIRPPKNIMVESWRNSTSQIVQASHDGYCDRFNLRHTRELHLSEKGMLLQGTDQFTTPDGKAPASLPIAIRFHLSPQVSASPLSSGKSILIAAPDGDAWSLTCSDCPITLEESIQFSGPGEPRKSQQIVLTVNPAETETVRWSLVQREKQTSQKSRKKQSTEKTPDLLDPLEL